MHRNTNELFSPIFYTPIPSYLKVVGLANTRRAIVCLTRVWQPLFCVKTFEFAIQTWQISLEHYYVYVYTYVLSQLFKMLILLIRSHCKICPLPTIQISRVCIVGNCWQWANFTMGINEQNQHFSELR